MRATRQTSPGRARAAQLLEAGAQRSRSTAQERLGRLRELASTIAQTALAAAGAWLAATELFGHARPFFAPMAAIIVLGVTRGRHAGRAVELAAGVSLGICVADLIIYNLGSSPLTIALVVALAMGAAIALGGEALFVSQAATSATLVATLPLPDHFTLARAVDALAGGAVALAAFCSCRWTRFGSCAPRREPCSPNSRRCWPISPRRSRHATANGSSTRSCAVASSTPSTQPSPRPRAWASRSRRTRRGALERYAHAAAQLDLAIRNVRVMARGTLRAVELEDNVPPDVVAAMHDLAAGVRALGPALDEPQHAPHAREAAVRAAARATRSLASTTNLSASAIVSQIRSTAVDLLRALGDDRETAAANLRAAAAEASPPR